MNHPPSALLKTHLSSQLMLSIPAHSQVLCQLLCTPVENSDAESPRIQPAVGEAGTELEKGAIATVQSCRESFLTCFLELIHLWFLKNTYHCILKPTINKTGKISLLEIHSLYSETPSSQSVWPKLSWSGFCQHCIFLPAALAGTWILHVNIFFSLLLKNTLIHESPSASVPAISLCWKSLSYENLTYYASLCSNPIFLTIPS